MLKSNVNKSHKLNKIQKFNKTKSNELIKPIINYEQIHEKEMYYIKKFGNINQRNLSSDVNKLKKIKNITNKDVLNLKITYISILDNEKIKIIKIENNYVLLSNGNYLNIETFKKLYQIRTKFNLL